jgi:hypothetical protein
MKKITLFSIFLSFYGLCISQVGIGTINPAAALDVESTTNGFLAPRVSLTSTLISAPIINPQGGLLPAGTMVYNTNTVADVTPGYYYWNGTIWVRMVGGTVSNDWSLTGNAGTSAGTNFLGTTDARDLRIKTGNTDRWNISNINNGQLQSYSRGTAALPTFSFQPDTNTGLFSPTADVLGLTTNGSEKLRVNSNGNVVIGNTMGAGGAKLHITGAGNTIRVDNLNSTNANNNGINNPVVKVNANGDFILEPSVNTAASNESSADSFLPVPVLLSSNNGAFSAAVIHTVSITLTKPTLVEVVFWTGCSVRRFNDGLITDDQARGYGVLVQETGVVTGTPVDVSYSANSYNNGSSAGTDSNFTLSGSGYITLPVGTHTFQVTAFALGGTAVGFSAAQGYRVNFGNNLLSRFQIIYHN